MFHVTIKANKTRLILFEPFTITSMGADMYTIFRSTRKSLRRAHYSVCYRHRNNAKIKLLLFENYRNSYEYH